MRHNYNICDCTLRDGGYYTNWDFDKRLVDLYFQTVNNIPAITHIEIGYRNLPKEKYYGEFFYCPEYILQMAKTRCPHKEIAIMLNEKDTSVNDLDVLLTPYKDYIDLIRIAVAPNNIERASTLSEVIKDHGFKVAFNIMYMSKWANNNSIIESLNNLKGKVDYIYMVDSFGSIYPDDLKAALNLITKKINIPIGFHGHNNMELGLSNTLIALQNGCSIVDATITGMGRGAGNLKTELLLTSLCSKGIIDFDFNVLSPLVEEFEKMQKIYNWGTNLPYMISGAYSLPQKDVMSWIVKRRYTTNSIINALQNKKNNQTDQSNIPTLKIPNIVHKAIIVGGGENACKHAHALKLLCEKHPDIILIHAGSRQAKLFNDLPNMQYYCLLGAEGNKLQKYIPELDLGNIKCVIEPSPREMGTILPAEIIKRTYELTEINFMKNYPDSLLTIAFQLALNMEIQTIYLYGLDGYDIKTDNQMIEVANENQLLINEITKLREVVSLTPTKYQNIKSHSIYSLL